MATSKAVHTCGIFCVSLMRQVSANLQLALQDPQRDPDWQMVLEVCQKPITTQVTHT